MPVLANSRHELYCTNRAGGFVPRKAAVAAGYPTGSSIYSELENSPEIVARIQELIDDNMAKREARLEAARQGAKVAGQLTGVGIGYVIEGLKINAEEAREAGDYKESNAALRAIGEHLGMWGKAGTPADSNAQEAEIGHLIDLDAIGKLAHVTNYMDDHNSRKVADPVLVMKLLEGQGANKVDPKSRRLQTGSETDVVIGDDETFEPIEAEPIGAKYVDYGDEESDHDQA